MGRRGLGVHHFATVYRYVADDSEGRSRSVTALVLLILGAVWAAVLIPPALRARAEASPGDTIGSFHHQLNILRRTGGYIPRVGYGEHGRVPLPPQGVQVSSADLAKKRRRDVLVTLLWVMSGTLALGLLPGFRGMLYLHVVADLLFVGYVVMLRRMKLQAEDRRAEARAKVTPIHRATPPGVTDLSLRRAANR